MIETTSSFSEKRRFRRYAVGLPCVVRPQGHGNTGRIELHTKTVDVSRAGVLFSAQSQMRLGSRIECTLQLPIKSIRNLPVTIRCQGKIVRVDASAAGSVGIGATIDSFEFVNVP